MDSIRTFPLLFFLVSSIASAFVDPSTSSSISKSRIYSLDGARKQVRSTTWRNRPHSSLRMVEDDDENPLARGIDSVSWLPSVYDSDPSPSTFDTTSEGENELTETLPLFPLGGIVYTPNSEHVLNIFEPRYRQMYNDILMNGSKRFVVSMCHPSEQGRFAQVGVLFSLEELKEVSEMTQDQVKYICKHRVVGRVKLQKVLNPEEWESRDTYLKVKGTIIDDTGALTKESELDDGMIGNISKKLVSAVKKAAAVDSIEKTSEEESLAKSFSDLVDLQHVLSEDVRFTRASVKSFSVAEGTNVDPNLWTSIRLWQSYAEQRLVANQNAMQKEFQERLVEYLKKETGKESDDELPSAIGFQDLSAELQGDLIDLQKRMTAELQPLMMEQTLSMQKILEAQSHEGRVELMSYFVDSERKRLQAKKTLKSMFDGSPSAIASKEVAESPSLPKELPKVEEAPKQQIFDDDGDAFQ